jgi:hypothetical protein
MRSNLTRLIVIVSILVILSLACGLSGKKETTNTPHSVTVRATKTLKPVDNTLVVPTKTAAPTSTPALPTSSPAATATPVPDLSLGEENRCEACGFTFKAIPGYSLAVETNSITMLEDGADSNVGPKIGLIGGPPETGMTMELMLESLKCECVEVSDPTPILVGGLTGLTVNVTGVSNEVEMAGQIVIIITSEQQFIAFGASPKEQWQREGSARFNEVLSSIAFFTPVVSLAEVPPVAPSPTPVTSASGEIRQWAVSAIASSWYGGGESWSPAQTTGEPNVTDCSDDARAWASSESSTVEWLELTYATPVNPTQVNIVQTYNPSYLVKVELIDAQGNYHEIYSGSGAAAGSCPFTLSVPVEDAGYQAVGVKITIDQTALEDWNEIDAVELVGR